MGVADHARLPGQRIAHAAALQPDIGVELRAAPADGIELERADAFDAQTCRARQIADRIAIDADGDVIHDILDPISIELQPRLAPAPEIPAELAGRFPALRRDEI